MDTDVAISKVLKDLNIEFELKQEQKSIIKAIINRADVFAVLPTSIFKSNIDREGLLRVGLTSGY